MDNALYCKIEKGDQQAKREQVVKLAELFEADCDELLSLWLADQVCRIIKDEELADKALMIVIKNMQK
jgi:hypothetical protein